MHFKNAQLMCNLCVQFPPILEIGLGVNCESRNVQFLLKKNTANLMYKTKLK